mmetsp:Transcript_15260/g.14816  ORF Transcript_15260/g.14816 Transcript_15260/m.14816 type:complete len:142 (-) Transcript_15260:1198-1623(-)
MLSKIVQGVMKKSRASQRAYFAARAFASSNKEEDALKPSAQADYGIQARESHLQFSKAPILANFGELPFGEIPEPLKYVRPFKRTTLSNGITVCTELTSSPLATVGVYVKAGSRNETPDTSGTAYLLEKMMTRGTSARSKT